MKIYTFRVIIEPDENNMYHGFVPALPGCHTCGSTIEETREYLKEAIKVYVLSLLDDGEPVPSDEDTFSTSIQVNLGSKRYVNFYTQAGGNF